MKQKTTLAPFYKNKNMRRVQVLASLRLEVDALILNQTSEPVFLHLLLVVWPRSLHNGSFGHYCPEMMSITFFSQCLVQENISYFWTATNGNGIVAYYFHCKDFRIFYTYFGIKMLNSLCISTFQIVSWKTKAQQQNISFLNR